MDHLVSSIHHQAIKRLGEDLVVEATSPSDGIIEAIRMRGECYVTGFQWHPEFHADTPGLLNSSPILEDFLSAARRQSSPKVFVRNPLKSSLLGNERLDRIGIGIHDHIPLWQTLQILKSRWTVGLFPNRLDDALRKFNGKCGL